MRLKFNFKSFWMGQPSPHPSSPDGGENGVSKAGRGLEGGLRHSWKALILPPTVMER